MTKKSLPEPGRLLPKTACLLLFAFFIFQFGIIFAVHSCRWLLDGVQCPRRCVLDWMLSLSVQDISASWNFAGCNNNISRVDTMGIGSTSSTDVHPHSLLFMFFSDNHMLISSENFSDCPPIHVFAPGGRRNKTTWHDLVSLEPGSWSGCVPLFLLAFASDCDTNMSLPQQLHSRSLGENTQRVCTKYSQYPNLFYAPLVLHLMPFRRIKDHAVLF